MNDTFMPPAMGVLFDLQSPGWPVGICLRAAMSGVTQAVTRTAPSAATVGMAMPRLAAMASSCLR